MSRRRMNVVRLVRIVADGFPTKENSRQGKGLNRGHAAMRDGRKDLSSDEGQTHRGSNRHNLQMIRRRFFLNDEVD